MALIFGTINKGDIKVKRVVIMIVENMKFWEIDVHFDDFSECNRKENLFKYLGLFLRGDPIPDNYFEDSKNPEAVSQ